MLLVLVLLAPLLLGFEGLPSLAAEQLEATKNRAADSQTVEQGRSLFRLACALCHGTDARGGRGPDLTSGRWSHGGTDTEIFRTAKEGVAGTEMPPAGGNMQDEEIWMIVSFLRSLRSNGDPLVTGNPQSGQKIFFGRGDCSQCHMVSGKGGRLGPDLSRIGAARSNRSLADSIRDPNKDIAREYETVIAVSKEDERITGVRKNEDTFSLQLMDAKEEFHLLLKKDLREVLYEKSSLMPVYSERELNKTDLQDLLAYLNTLK
jgi:cytochrome c oxidase cbb3-type subunit 3